MGVWVHVNWCSEFEEKAERWIVKVKPLEVLVIVEKCICNSLYN